MSKEQTFLTRVENVENSILKTQAKLINELELVDKMKIVAIKKLDLANAFTSAIELVAAEHGEEKVPDSCSDLYNHLHMEEESPLDKAPEKKTKKKLIKKKGADSDKTKKKGPPSKPVDKYGTREGTLANTFVKEVKKKSMTMAEARKTDWNPRGYHFDGTVERLVEEKLAEIDKDGVIEIK
jgi:hypothetical protein